MNVVITITLPRNANTLGIASDLYRRFGDDQVSVVIEDDVADEDEVDEDMLLTILHGASQRMGDSPEARQLAQLVNALQAPPAARLATAEEVAAGRRHINQTSAGFAKASDDDAPPHGMRRPETVRYVRPNPTLKRTGNTPDRTKALEALIMNTSCPTCHAARGASCRSAKPGAPVSTYGTQHVHQARIKLMPWADDK